MSTFSVPFHDEEKIYYYLDEKNEWILIENKMINIFENHNFILSPKSESQDYDAVVRILPDQKLFPNDGKPVNIRVIVFGNIFQNNITKEQVAAYYDVTLEP